MICPTCDATRPEVIECDRCQGTGYLEPAPPLPEALPTSFVATWVVQTGGRRWYLGARSWSMGVYAGTPEAGWLMTEEGKTADVDLGQPLGDGSFVAHADGHKGWAVRFEDCPHTATDGWADDGTRPIVVAEMTS